MKTITLNKMIAGSRCVSTLLLLLASVAYAQACSQIIRIYMLPLEYDTYLGSTVHDVVVEGKRVEQLLSDKEKAQLLRLIEGTYKRHVFDDKRVKLRVDREGDSPIYVSIDGTFLRDGREYQMDSVSLKKLHAIFARFDIFKNTQFWIKDH